MAGPADGGLRRHGRDRWTAASAASSTSSASAASSATRVVIFLSDNGGCAENVHPDWYDIPSKTRDGRPIHVGNDPDFMPGPEEVYQSYGPAWANASNTPFRRFKHWTEEGGISTPFIVRWPGGLKDRGRIERDAGGRRHRPDADGPGTRRRHVPRQRGGHDIVPPEGKSLLPAFTGGKFDRGPLFWEHEGNRAVRLGDWKLRRRARREVAALQHRRRPDGD